MKFGNTMQELDKRILKVARLII